MSTISLMPINKKFKLTKDYKFTVGRSFLGDAQKILQEAGMSVGTELIMDEGSKMRIEGFTASVSDKNWPAAKVTIYPEGKKQCQCYIQMSELDGITWETIEGEAPKEKKEVQRINVSVGNYATFDKWGHGIWHKAYKDRWEREDKSEKILNVLELNDSEINKGQFKAAHESDVAEVVVKKGKECHVYKIYVNSVFTFKISTKPGFMLGKLHEVKDSVYIGEGYYPAKDKLDKICDIENPETIDFTKLATQYLKKKHNFE